MCFSDLFSTHSPIITYEFGTTAFESCSATCGGGTQTRNVTCYRLADGIRNMVVDDWECTDIGLVRPAMVQECSPQRCPEWVIYTEYTPVS